MYVWYTLLLLKKKKKMCLIFWWLQIELDLWDFNTNFSNISVISWWSFFLRHKPKYSEKASNLDFLKELEDTNGAIRIHILKKTRQHKGQMKKSKRTNNNLQNIHIKLKSVKCHYKEGVCWVNDKYVQTMFLKLWKNIYN